jgi:hypothetical protein
MKNTRNYSYNIRISLSLQKNTCKSFGHGGAVSEMEHQQIGWAQHGHKMGTDFVEVETAENCGVG